MTSTIRHLDHAEIIGERPFTHPEHSRNDLTILREMAETLRRQVGSLTSLPWNYPQPLLSYLREPSGHKHRVLVVDPGGLLTSGEIFLVGFFGHKRAGADLGAIEPIDSELNSELLQNPHFLSYSSRELGDGNWGNLVLLRSLQGIDHWMSSVRHAYAVHELAPDYYDAIRLHNGILPAGLTAIERMELLRTKYYDFRGGAIWRAIREFF